MRVLIIGGTRFIGPQVVSQLVEQSCQVVVFHRGNTRVDLPDGVAHMQGDRKQMAQHSDAFRRFAPQVVLDMIPLLERDALDVMHTFKGIAERVVAVSSQDVYGAYGKLIGAEAGPVDPIPLTEAAPLRERLYPYRGVSRRAVDDPRRWMDDYDKILVERVVLSDPDLPGTVLRLPMVYGPRDAQHRLFEHLKRMDDGCSAILMEEGVARWRWTRGYVENVAAAITLAVTDQRAAGRVYNVGEREAASTREWVVQIGQAAGWSGEVIVASKERLPEHLRPDVDTQHLLVTDSTRIREELGYAEGVSRDEALRRTVAWERANPPEQVDPRQFDYAAEDAALAELGRGVAPERKSDR